MSNTINIFYSWQSDLPESENMGMIRDSLERAKDDIEKNGKDVKIHEAARGLPGSPNIEVTLFEQILQSDIFVCDVSIVNHACECASNGKIVRRMPNPNVLLELGYAAGCLGWHRVIMVHNKASGGIEKLPFDIRGRVVVDYNSNGENMESTLGGLLSGLKEKIETIITNDPKKPILYSMSETEKRQRDIKTLYDLLSYLNFPILYQYINYDAPEYRSANLINMADAFIANINSQHVYFNDNELGCVFFSLKYAIDESLKYDNLFHSIGNGEKFHITFSPIGPNQDEEKQYSELGEARTNLARSIYDFQNYIKEHYIEVDLDVTDSRAHSFLRD